MKRENLPLGGEQVGRIAVVGGGIAGLGSAWLLSQRYAVTVFEAGSYAGGHANTVEVSVGGKTFPVDTGFLVFNRRTYPNLCGLFDHLKVPVANSEMSFSVSLEAPDIEWAGTNLATLFAQTRNLARPVFWGMLADMRRFNSETTRLARDNAAPLISLGEYLRQNNYSAAFRDWYLLPMAAAIWSCPTEQMLAYPLATFLRFCHNHGLLQVLDRPQWLTVAGGSREYVKRLCNGAFDVRLSTPVLRVQRTEDGVLIHSTQGAERFDAVVFACHSDQALQILGDGATRHEQAVLGAVRYQANKAWLHTDIGLLPRRRGTWAAWNYRAGKAVADQRPVSVSYWLNRLQPLPTEVPVVVSLNPFDTPRENTVLASFDYMHPVFDQGALDAQAHLPALQGQHRTWFCGAWTAYGFHEDGLKSAVDVAAGLGVVAPWRAQTLPAFGVDRVVAI